MLEAIRLVTEEREVEVEVDMCPVFVVEGWFVCVDEVVVCELALAEFPAV